MLPPKRLNVRRVCRDITYSNRHTLLANLALKAHQVQVAVATIRHGAVDGGSIVVNDEVARLPKMFVHVPAR